MGRLPELLRRPLLWMIAAEVVVVALLLGAAWHLYSDHRLAPAPGPRPASAPVTAAVQPQEPPPTHSRVPEAASVSPRPPTATAAPRFPFDFRTLNGDAAAWERSEQQVALSLTAAIRGYLESVVLPAVERAESVRPAITPASTQSPAAIRNTP